MLDIDAALMLFTGVVNKERINTVSKKQYPGGIALVGSVLVGVGVGMLKNHVGPYALLGVGVGFVLVALIRGRS